MTKIAIYFSVLALALAAAAPEPVQPAVTQLEKKDYYSMYLSAYSQYFSDFGGASGYSDYASYVSDYFSKYGLYYSDYGSDWDLYYPDLTFNPSDFGDYSYLGDLYSAVDYSWNSDYLNAWESFLAEPGVSSELEAFDTLTNPQQYAGAASTFLAKHSKELALLNSRFSDAGATLFGGLAIPTLSGSGSGSGATTTGGSGEASNTSEPDQSSHAKGGSELSAKSGTGSAPGTTSKASTTGSSSSRGASSAGSSSSSAASSGNAADSNKPAMVLGALLGGFSLLLL